MARLAAAGSRVNVGDQIGSWTVQTAPEKLREHGCTVWRCNVRCVCGKEKFINTRSLVRRLSLSCGCQIETGTGRPRKVHGESGTPLYKVWKGMLRRCNNNHEKAYPNYGGRGIKVCDEWDTDFMAFREWAMANGYEQGLEIDRRDNDKGYAPDNCRFVTAQVNGNNKRSNRLVTAFGETKTVADWSRDPRCKVPRVCFAQRIITGKLSAEEALSMPSDEPRNRAMLTAFGETKSVAKWAKDARCAVKRSCLEGRLRLGWDVERAMTAPVEVHAKR